MDRPNMDVATVVTLAQAANGNINVPAWTFLTVAVSAICTPLINAAMRRIDKRADWKRQDEVQQRHEKYVHKRFHDVIEVSNATAVHVVNNSEQLDEIHGLVNGHLSAAMESELDSKRTQLALMREVAALKGGDPSPGTVDAIAQLEGAIEKLSEAVTERRRIDAESKAQATRIAAIKAKASLGTAARPKQIL